MILFIRLVPFSRSHALRGNAFMDAPRPATTQSVEAGMISAQRSYCVSHAERTLLYI